MVLWSMPTWSYVEYKQSCPENCSAYNFSWIHVTITKMKLVAHNAGLTLGVDELQPKQAGWTPGEKAACLWAPARHVEARVRGLELQKVQGQDHGSSAFWIAGLPWAMAKPPPTLFLSFCKVEKGFGGGYQSCATWGGAPKAFLTWGSLYPKTSPASMAASTLQI